MKTTMLVNKQAAEVVPKLTKELHAAKYEYATTKLSLNDAHDKINNLDIKLANQTDSHTSVITEMRRLATGLYIR
jgi:hypothetical protein